MAETAVTSNLGWDNFFSTTTTGALTATTTTIPLATPPTSTEGFLVLDPGGANEIIFYNSVSGNNVIVPTTDDRGRGDTTAQAHSSGITVKMNTVGMMFEALQSGLALTASAITTVKIADNAVTSAKLAVIPFCRTSDATQSFTSGNAAAVSFDTEVTDTDTMFDSGTPTRITIKTAGIYQINGNLNWDANATGRRALHIYIDGAAVASQESLPGGNYGYGQQVSCSRSLAVNSYIELVGLQTAGTINATGSVLSVAYLGKAS